MKHISLYIIGVVAQAMTLSSCSDEWLDAENKYTTTEQEVFKDTEHAAMAINGLARLMYQPYVYNTGTSASASWNGEGSIKFIYGNCMGQNFVVANRNAFGPLYMGGTYMTNPTSVYDYFPWNYYYRLVSNANMVINQIDKASGSQAKRDFYKAQGLTYRAYAFFMLAQFYGRRYLAKNAPQTRGIVLRLTEGSGAMAASTLEQTYQQILSDLNEAISLYGQCGMTRSQGDVYTPDIHVAQAIKARVALTMGDWQTAADAAAKAREGFTLMTNAEYLSGFNTPNQEWIWGSYSSEQQNAGQYSFFSQQMGYNRNYYLNNPVLISKRLYDQLPATDIRRQLFLGPQEGEAYSESGNTVGFAANSSALGKRAWTEHPDMKGAVYAYMNFKFRTADDAATGQGCLNHIRASEMYLAQAEAECRLGHDGKAAQLLYELVHDSGRDEAYTLSTHTGDELLLEIKYYRNIELWGEGFDWFDMKRWGETIDRRPLPEDNFYGKLMFIVTPEENNGWRWVYPELETNYNSLVTPWDNAQ